MRRTVLWIFACVFALLGVAAALALAGLQSEIGLLSHIVPAGLLVALLDAFGMYVPRDGLLIGHAHGPPVLRPLGIIVIYGLPAAGLVLLLLRTQRTKRDRVEMTVP